REPVQPRTRVCFNAEYTADAPFRAVQRLHALLPTGPDPNADVRRRGEPGRAHRPALTPEDVCDQSDRQRRRPEECAGAGRHRTLDMTMRIYARIHSQTKRQALAKLSYGQGTLARDHILPYPGNAAGFSVPNGHQSVTTPKAAAVVST